VRALGRVGEAEMWEVFNMGCGFCAVVGDEAAGDAVAVLERHHPGTRRIGTVTGEADRLTLPGLGIAGGPEGLRAA
jgi:phosphoribosylformylglycinamidine cyclo-ligase